MHVIWVFLHLFIFNQNSGYDLDTRQMEFTCVVLGYQANVASVFPGHTSLELIVE